MGERQVNTTPGGSRTKLSEALPLDTPYMIQMFPTYACNFRCNFCIHALDRSQHGYISDCTSMNMDLYRKCIDDMKSFPRKLKMLRFAAIGEPLLHPQIAQMIAYAKQADIADSVDIVTNGALLTHELSDALIEAGLDRLRISVEGLSSEDYRTNANADLDFSKFVDQIRYFYEHCKNTHIYIKIIDYMVSKPDQKEKFFQTFQSICHSIAIEHLTPTIAEIDYEKISGGQKNDKPQNGEQLLHVEVCPQPFYMMQINSDGKVVPCCSMKYPAILGDVNEQSVTDIWTGINFQQFRSKMLESREIASSVCKACNLYLYDMHPEDILDDHKEHLKKFFTI